MNNGISVYPGLDNTAEENLQLIEEAATCGIRRLFTSLHIPESDITVLKRELTAVLKVARAYGMEVISDVSPRTLSMLDMQNLDLDAFRRWGICTLRLDYGFDAAAIAELTRNRQGISLQINAGTATETFLNQLRRAGADFSRVDALHNFYPRSNTGVSEEFFCGKNALLHKAGIKVGAFVPSAGKKRGPLGEGLPTLEDHRAAPFDLAVRHLAALGTDSVFIGDSLPLSDELAVLAKLDNKEIVLHAGIVTNDPWQRELLSRTFTSRPDEARDAIRAQEGRKYISSTVAAENTVVRPPGAITIDNAGYGRYMGELQIVTRPLPADERVNVVGYVAESELFMLKYIKPECKFSFAFG